MVYLFNPKRCCTSDADDVYPCPFVQFVADMLLFALFFRDFSWVDGHLRVGSWCSAFGERAWVDYQDAVYYLFYVVSVCCMGGLGMGHAL